MNIDEIKRIKVIKYKCLQSTGGFEFFCRYMFKEIHQTKFIVKPFHKKLFKLAERILSCELKRVIINIPPRYSKTEIFVKMFIAYGYLINPKSKFIHLSYSDKLALDNSAAAKEYIQSVAFQSLLHLELKADAKAKGCWHTKQGGTVYATASGGAITGFGAGIQNSEIFSGAIIWDDPHKPDDAKSDVKREAVNERYSNTVRSRTNDPNTPIIIIMQRLHEGDMSGHLIAESDEDWHHCKIPVYDEAGDPIYPEKHSKQELQSMEKDAYTFSGQYMQEPSPLEGGKIKRDWFEIVEKEIPNNDLYIDGAYTKETQNDPTGIMPCYFENGILYISGWNSKHLEMPELLKYVPRVAAVHNVKKTNRVRIEPKASGKTLKQLLISETKLNASEINGKHVNEGKFARVDACSPTMEAGRVKLIKGIWNESFLKELAVFPNGLHDEAVDDLCYAIYDKFNLLKPEFGTA